MASPSKVTPRHRGKLKKEEQGSRPPRACERMQEEATICQKTLDFQEFHPFPGFSVGSAKTDEPEAPPPAKFANACLSPSSNYLDPPVSKAQGSPEDPKNKKPEEKNRCPAQPTLPLLLSTTEFHYICSCLADFLAQHSGHCNRPFCTASAITKRPCSLQTCVQRCLYSFPEQPLLKLYAESMCSQPAFVLSLHVASPQS